MENTNTPQHQIEIVKLNRRCELLRAERDVAKDYLKTAQANLQERNAEVDALKEEIRNLKNTLRNLAK